MSTIDIGKIKIVWKGAWDSSTAYTVDDAVSHSGNSYICIQAGSNQNPSSATAYWQIMASAGTNGTDADLLNIASTAQGDIYYNNGSAIARLAPGTANQVLQTGGASANPSWGTVSSDYVLLGTTTPTTLSSGISIDGYFSSTYDTYKIVFNEFLHSDISGNNYNSRFRVNIGNSAQSNAVYNRGWARSDVSSGGGSLSAQSYNWNSDNVVFNYGSTNTPWAMSGEIIIFNPLDTTYYKKIYGTTLGSYDNSTTNFGHFFCLWKDTRAISGITLFCDAQVKAKQVKIYGLK
jgi:hypothetical protein